MASGAVTLPSIHDRPDMYGPPSARSWDSRASGYGPSPNSGNGYPPPPNGVSVPPATSYSPASSGGAYHPPAQQVYTLPPVQQQHTQDPRSSYPIEHRTHPYYASAPNGFDYGYRQDRGPTAAFPPEYTRGGIAGGAVISHGQSAPRQRTSIACKYCRRRKIRCSGYANSPGGKCTNCIKMHQECVFQPVSSTSSTAFVPVSALPNGVPPGVQLFGAYGQPIAQPSAQPSNYPPGAGFQAPQTTQAPQQHYDQPLPSPTGSNGSYWEDRPENNRRRHRLSDDHGVRLPPPNTFPDDNAQRRSPSSGSPGHLQPFQASQPQPIPHQGLDSRTPPPRGSPSVAPASNAPGNSVMNLENLITSNSTTNDIDRGMLGRLNRRAN
ncbi:hypothetical protein NUW58_g1749 [Xylaria curta]|uniref:Uncharacterized protein n=1 Tax=Xylaria curta TaxID=42375 RepID=A0ACC1PKU9_9PEZI|nr:hypothetical protein NUW58_g1749 [Xylaria curta]